MKMRLALVAMLICAGAAAAGVVTRPPNGGLSSCAEAHVYIVLDPNVGVAPASSFVDGGTWQTGDIWVDVQFIINSNKEQLKLMVEASDLYKGNDPSSEVSPITLDVTQGVDVVATNANPMAGASATHAHVGPGDPATTEFGTFPMQKFQETAYESSQDNVWRDQTVTVTVHYVQPDPNKPMGEYSGVVRLCAMTMPGIPQSPPPTSG